MIYKVIYKLILFVSGICCYINSTAQSSNADYTKGSINVNLPKSPEAHSYEKYGNIPVDEYSGVPNISIPLYTVTSRFLSLPITLSYSASGIKVNQEATWVGLGFNLIAGGCVTIETRGNVDPLQYSQQFRDGAKRLFNKWGTPYGPYQNVANNAIKVGYAFLDYGEIWGNNDPIYHRGDTLWDEKALVTSSAWDGTGQPDIYHANFMGHSFSFYFDLETDEIKFLGEQNTFKIEVDRSANYGLPFTDAIKITDNAGVQYFFNQKESTNYTIPFGGTLNFNTNAVSAWLLTKILKDNDEINLTYSNYGVVKPAVTWSQSITGHMPNPVNDPGDTRQNITSITNRYLTKIETNSAEINFSLSSRVDLEGDGARKLDRITVKSKQSNAVIKDFVFAYDYFIASAETGDNNLPDYKSKRLRLLSVKENNSKSSPWKFYYNTTPGPNKYSFSQDHWGYFNNAGNLNLIPSWSSFVNPSLGLHYEPSSSCTYNPPQDQCYSQLLGYSIPSGFSGTANRSCNPQKMLVYSMDSIVYPTGGASKFTFEPHQSTFAARQLSNFIGGGMRVAKIQSYIYGDVIAGTIKYDYQNTGKYLGNIEYLKVSTKWPQGNSFTLSAWGIQNNDVQNVGYGSVKVTRIDPNNQLSNGHEIKYFKVNDPLNPEHVHAPQPYCYYSNSSVCNSSSANNSFYYLDRSGNGPMPKKDLDGKMYRHEFYNSNSTLIKSIDYYYRQQNIVNRFYSVRAEDNYLGYQYTLAFQQATYSSSDLGQGPASYPINWRRWLVSLERGISYYTLLDSVVEKTLQPSGSILKLTNNYKYNNYYQLEFSTSHNSDGTQSILYTKTPVSFLPYPPVPSNGEGEALNIRNMIDLHIWDPPLEQIKLLRKTNGDTIVVGASYHNYESGRLKHAYKLETNKSLAFRTEFVPSFYTHNYPTLPSYYLTRDPKYKIQETAEYYGSGELREVLSVNSSKAYIWDTQNNKVLATCENASFNDIAFSSFETATTGSWTFSTSPTQDLTAPTGSKVLAMNSSISKANLNSGLTYIISLWTKTTDPVLSGTNSSNTDIWISNFSIVRTVGLWRCIQASVTGVNTLYLNSNSAVIDELQLYPKNSLFQSYSYNVSQNLQAVSDAKNLITYYDYDVFGRLSSVRDLWNNTLKKICYNYAGLAEDCFTCVDTTANWQNTTTALQCEVSNGANTGYQLQEQRNINSCSGNYDYTRWVLAGYNTTACPLPPANVNLTSTNVPTIANYIATYTNVSTNHTYSFGISSSSGLQSLGAIPPGTYNLTIHRNGSTNPLLDFSSGCNGQTISGTSATFYNISVSSTTCNSITIEYGF